AEKGANAAGGKAVIFNTIYDPTDGDDALLPALGFSPAFRAVYEAVNADIRALARHHGFRLADLAALFRGHGLAAARPWIIRQIEPNLDGATAIAGEWERVYRSGK
ncbi:MAG TPA: hypothetical protein PK794_05425, partial [Armatimonadota bacterium]|nr:hypothetical protein [Armatimonadota bacterium]